MRSSTSPALVRSMANLIGGAQFQIVENAGHLPNVEQPQAFKDLILAFLEQAEFELPL